MLSLPPHLSFSSSVQMQETLTDRLEARDDEVKTGEDSSCEELIMEEVQEEEHKNDTEVQGGGGGGGLGLPQNFP